MLYKVILENYKIYKNKTVFDIQSSNVAMVFGPDNEGKSTLLNSIKFFLDLSVSGKNIKDGLYLSLLSDANEYSLDFFFLINKENIHYKVKYNPTNGDTYEHLSIEDNAIFERNNKKIQIVKLNDSMNSNFKLDSLFIHKLVTQMKFDNNVTLDLFCEFLKNSMYINPLRKSIISYSSNYSNLKNYIENNGVEVFNEFLKNNNLNILISYSNHGVNKKFNIKISEKISKTIFVTHQSSKTTLPITEESQSIQSLLNLLPSFFHFKKNKGMLLIDNLSNVLNSTNEKALIAYFLNNNKSSNFIFISNNFFFLINKTINPNNIYITYNKPTEGSSMIPLSKHKSKSVTQSSVDLKSLPKQKYTN